LAWLAAEGIMNWSPKFLIILEPRAVMFIAGSGLLMGLLAALLPARMVAGLDPAQVFRK
jgi:ABC-type lipoprotein release transport system permease subunit